MHILIVGAPGVGKSTLIQKLLEHNKKPLFGFETKKEHSLAHRDSGDPIYIYEVGKPGEQREDRLIAWCKDRRPIPKKEVFDKFAQKLTSPIPKNALILMDEIGFLEQVSPAFCKAVLRLLDGDIPILAAVKDKDTPFLQAVRTHPKARCFHITEENRNSLFSEISEYIHSLRPSRDPEANK